MSTTKSKEKERTMRKVELSKLLSVPGRILLAFLFLFSQSAWAGQDQKVKDSATASPRKSGAQQATEKQSSVTPTAKAQSKQAHGEESESSVAEEKSSGDGKHEGIKVHGHWTIEVRNPDGAVVTHREFENSLVTNGTNSGSAVLAAILACFTAGNCPNHTNVLVWEVQLDGSPEPCTGQIPDPNNPVGTITGPAPCVLQGPAPNYPNYTLTATAQGTAFVLQGTVAAGENGSITKVSTFLPGSGPFAANFTAATLQPAQIVQVSTGQTIAVTVTISFS
jgi:hypothetical protein